MSNLSLGSYIATIKREVPEIEVIHAKFMPYVAESDDEGWEEACSSEYPQVSVSLFILGGADEQVAKAILNYKPVGVELNGDFIVDVFAYGYMHSIRWFNLNYSCYTQASKAAKHLSKLQEFAYHAAMMEQLQKELQHDTLL